MQLWRLLRRVASRNDRGESHGPSEEMREPQDPPVPDSIRFSGDFRRQPRVEQGVHSDPVPEAELDAHRDVPSRKDALADDDVGHGDGVRAPGAERRHVESEDSVDLVSPLGGTGASDVDVSESRVQPEGVERPGGDHFGRENGSVRRESGGQERVDPDGESRRAAALLSNRGQEMDVEIAGADPPAGVQARIRQEPGFRAELEPGKDAPASENAGPA